MGRLQGKTAFVTGAAGGLGRAIALAFAAEGARVAMADVNERLLAESVAAHPDPRLVPVRCDVADRADVRAKIDRFATEAGGLDILVNNAVKFHYAPLAEFDPEIVDSMLAVGLKGALWALQAATPHLVARGGGCVVNLSSIAVSMAIPNASVYTAIKGAIDALTRQQAAELGPHGIRVNALAPGSVPTPGANAVITAEGWKSREGKTVLRRLPTADDVARAAVFLASDDAASITGETLKIDAGMTVTGP